MTRVVINAVSVKEGGSLVVLRELLRGMAALRPDWYWSVIANSTVRDLPSVPRVDYLSFPEIDGSGLKVRLWYERELPRLLKRLGANVLFSQTNYVPARALCCPSLLLVQNAGHFSVIFDRLTRESTGAIGGLAWRAKRRWVRSCVRAADLVTVQTRSLADEIIDSEGCTPDHVRVVAHGSGQFKVQARPLDPPSLGERLRVGYVTKRGVQKNFDVLFAAVARLNRQGTPVTLVLTLDPADPVNTPVLERARRLVGDRCLENHGELAGG